jgi:acid phosphatase type 7
MISSEHDPSPGMPLGDWLAADLAAVDRSLTPWLLVGIHRPIVETELYESDYDVAAGLRAILEPLLLRHSVDVVLAGHYHSFQRSCPMANLTCVSKGGIVHYTTGAAGSSLDAVDACCYNNSYIERTILGEYGYSVISAPNASALHLAWYFNSNNSLGDEAWVFK